MSDRIDDEILFYAFRYALGRMTYAVKDVSDEIIRRWDKMSYKFQYLIQKEIKEAIKDGSAGMQMDIDQWNKVLLLKPKEQEQ